MPVNRTPAGRSVRRGLLLHCGAEMIAQNVEQLYLGRAVNGNGDTVALADAHGHELEGISDVSTAGTHFQSAVGIGVALGQLRQTAGGA